ncbi:MAG: tetratricopeptide repeat protein, partial [Planctomycetota bacterium]
MRRRALLAAAFLLVAVVVAEAGREDDFDFAQGLVERKFYDLAKEEFQKIIDDTSRTGDERANGELGLALLLKAQASDARTDSKKSAEEILGLFDEAESRFDKFLSEFTNHPKLDKAKFEVGNLLWAKGDFLAKRIKREPDKAESYRKIAELAFDTAIDLFKEVAQKLEARVDELLEDLDEDDPRVAEAEWSMKRAQFFHVVSYYYKGLIYPEDSEDRRGVLSKAVERIDEFVWDNEDNILGGYAYLYYALSKKEMDDPAGAMELLKTVTGYPVPDKAKEPGKFWIWTELMLQAYKELGAYCNELEMRGDKDYRDEAKLQLEEMQQKIPDVEDRKFGHFALLEYSRALMGLGKLAEAMAVATLVSQKGEELAELTEWGGATAFLANRLLNDIIAIGEDVSLPPDVLLKAAFGKMTSRQWPQAVRAFQKVIRASKSDEEIKQFASVAWMKIGLSYYMEDKFLEAYYAYQYVMNHFAGLKDEEGEDL